MQPRQQQLPSSNKLSGIVVVGEASDSDVEDEDLSEDSITPHRPVGGGGGNCDNRTSKLDQQQQPPNDDSLASKQFNNDNDIGQTISKTITTITTATGTNHFANKFVSSTALFDERHQKSNQSDSLLHSLLKESNKKLKNNILATICTPYVRQQHDIGQLTRSLIATQRNIQSSYATLHKTTLTKITQLDQAFVNLERNLQIQSSHK